MRLLAGGDRRGYKVQPGQIVNTSVCEVFFYADCNLCGKLKHLQRQNYDQICTL